MFRCTFYVFLFSLTMCIQKIIWDCGWFVLIGHFLIFYHIELPIALYPKPLCRTLIDGLWHQQQPKSKIVPRLKWLSAEICVLPSMVAPQSKHQRNNWETKGIHSNPKFVLRSSSRTQNVAAASTAANFEFMILDMHTAHCS